MREFRRVVWSHYKKNGRHDLPWRKTTDPHKILVSEIMLQQTQVPRVIGKYKEFVRAFPNVRTLAHASLGHVLRIWSGLGYNRRGKYLHDAARAISQYHEGKVPQESIELEKIPGMGPYTVSAIRVFAFNEPDVLIETNIRTAFIHHFFENKKTIRDSELIPFAQAAAKKQDPRTWHWALMDYGANLKKSGVRNNHKSAHYTKQSKFEGSLRQVRGAILRELHKGPSSLKNLEFDKGRITSALASLAHDGLIVKQKGSWRIA